MKFLGSQTKTYNFFKSYYKTFVKFYKYDAFEIFKEQVINLTWKPVPFHDRFERTAREVRARVSILELMSLFKKTNYNQIISVIKT